MNGQDYNALEDNQDLRKKRSKKRYLTEALHSDYKKPKFTLWWPQLVVSALATGSSGLGSSPGQGHGVVFLGKALYSHSASLHPGV